MKTKTILVIDDNLQSLEEASLNLSGFYKIIMAKSGNQALRILRQRIIKSTLAPIDLILLDVQMPDMNGFEAIKQIKELMSQVPVIFLTSTIDSEIETKAFEVGAADYVSKPFNPSTLRARVNAHIKIFEQINTIKKLMNTDPLTEVYNRRYFTEIFHREWKRSFRDKTTISFVMLDLDLFKEYNDKYGHPQGDRLLIEFSKLLENSLRRKGGDLAARIGGEEFAVILPNTDSDGAMVVANKILESTRKMSIPLANGKPTSITVSIGVSSRKPHTQAEYDKGIEELYSATDKLLYEAKKNGRNRICKG